MTFHRLLSLCAILLLVAGCSIGQRIAEFRSGTRAAPPLEVPPELTTPASDDRFAIPDPRAQSTYSAYQQRGTQPAIGRSGVLPPIEGARVERAGDQRWLVVKGQPEAVWPKVREFFVDAGYRLIREMPEVGIMETDWYEDRTKIEDDFVRRTLGRVLDRMWSTGTRDKFRIRLEKGSEPGTTEVYLSHRGLEEVYTSSAQDSTKWQPRPVDRELEAEMLTRIMARIGAPETRVAAAKPGATPAAGARAVPSTEPRNAVLEGGALIVNDSFDRAWRRVGLALDRVGFTVEDRDRSKGIFFVRYIDPDADSQAPAKKEGFFDKLQFWKSAPKASTQPQYRIHVGDAGGGLSQVEVQTAQGSRESGATGRRILALLFDQLK